MLQKSQGRISQSEIDNFAKKLDEEMKPKIVTVNIEVEDFIEISSDEEFRGDKSNSGERAYSSNNSSRGSDYGDSKSKKSSLNVSNRKVDPMAHF